jgi:ubiquinone/menaquinone biosynthesis C-methylase UbiE
MKSEQGGTFHMQSLDVRFSGSVPANYERYMVPLLFRPYAELLAGRAAKLQPQRILETAAGTGVVTAALSNAVPAAEIVATDLNQAMIDVAQTRVNSSKVTFRQADALELPFDDGSFDLVVCQFGVMFYPDKVKGNAEARRVLRDGGTYMFAVWDTIERNLLSHLANESMRRAFPDNPPQFMVRGPFSYHKPEWIERDLRASGFTDIAVETVGLISRSGSSEDAARALCYGSPMGIELEEYGSEALDRIFANVAQCASEYEGADGFEAPMSAHIVTATK